MVDDATFRAAILAAPDDDGPRLVYADWLEEAGETARAEFIRVQCELARLPDRDPGRAALRDRERALLRDHRDAWLKPLTDRLAADRLPDPIELFHGLTESLARFSGSPEEAALPRLNPAEAFFSQLQRLPGLIAGPRPAPQFGFRRGFVEVVVAAPVDFLHHAEALFAAVPLRELHALTGEIPGTAALLFDSPHVGRLAGLRLVGRVWPIEARALARSPHLGRLRRLDLRDAPLPPDSLQSVLRLRNVPGLRELDLSANMVGGDGAEVLAGHPGWAKLEVLRLTNCGLRDRGLRALAGSAALASLTGLHVADNDITPAGVLALAASPLAGRLTELDLSGNRLKDTAVQSVARRLTGRGPAAWARRLIASPLADGLRRLRLGDTPLDPDTRAALAERFGDRLE